MKLSSCVVASQDVSSQQMARPKKTGYAAPTQTFGEWLRQMREEKDVPLRVVAAAARSEERRVGKECVP